MADIPEGYGIIAGRSKDNAQKALAAADAAKVDQLLVRTVAEGYLVPEAVLVAFEKANKPEPVKKAPAKKPAAKAAAKTDDAVAESETDKKEE